MMSTLHWVSEQRACGLCRTSLVFGSNADYLQDELSEEDQQLKDELEMLVERLKVRQIPYPSFMLAMTLVLTTAHDRSRIPPFTDLLWTPSRTSLKPQHPP